jgi:class 3 adenylate cyclase/TolB-like protein/Flp pilus assembly protein TadD
MNEPHTEHRRLAAIMFTDMVGYSALAQRSESLALELLEEHRRILRGIFPRHHGREIETVGDGFLVEFISALEATECAVAIQQALAERNRLEPAGREIRLRIGIHVGDVMLQADGHVLGDGVNIAARIQPLAAPGGICVTRAVYEQVQNKLELPWVEFGRAELKNIRVPVVVYRVVAAPGRDRGAVVRWLGGASRGHPVAVWICALALLLGAGAWWFWLRPHASGAPRAAAPAVPGRKLAVKPLEILSGDTNQAWLADGMTEALTSELASVQALAGAVYPRASMLRFKGSPKPVSELARELSVGSIVTGAVLSDGKRMRVNVQLIDAGDRQVWQESFDRDLSDFFKVQTELTRGIAAQVAVRLTGSEQERLGRARAVNPAAVEAYLKGRAQWARRSTAGWREAAALFQQAVDLDPEFAPAQAGLADVYGLGYIFSDLQPAVIRDRAKAAAQAAIRLDPKLADAHISLGYILSQFEWNFPAARHEYELAIALRPDSAQAHYWYAMDLAKQRLFGEAIAQAELAVRHDPHSAVARWHLGGVYYTKGDFDRAIEELTATLKLEPDFAYAYAYLAAAYVRKGPAFRTQTLAAVDQALRLERLPWTLGNVGYALAALGERERALALLNELATQAQSGYVPAYYRALIHAGLGDSARALEALREDFASQSPLLPWITVAPAFDGMRALPEFIDLVAKVNPARR